MQFGLILLTSSVSASLISHPDSGACKPAEAPQEPLPRGVMGTLDEAQSWKPGNLDLLWPDHHPWTSVFPSVEWG